MALQEIHFQALNAPLVDLAQRTRRQDDPGRFIDPSPAYQRASVWTYEQRVELIKSLLQGLPIGSVFINERPFPASWVVVDGKQRLETVAKFVNDELAVPADWFPEEHLALGAAVERTGLVTWSNLSHRGRMRCRNHWLIAMHRTELRTETAERELYERINYGGTPHEPLERPAREPETATIKCPDCYSPAGEPCLAVEPLACGQTTLEERASGDWRVMPFIHNIRAAQQAHDPEFLAQRGEER